MKAVARTALLGAWFKAGKDQNLPKDMVSDAEGALVKRATDVSLGEALTLRFADGARRKRSRQARMRRFKTPAESKGIRQPRLAVLIFRLKQKEMVRLGGLEPPTSGATNLRSNQLSYNRTRQRLAKRPYG